MGEIININIGKAGIKIGQKFLESIAQQHFQNNQDIRGRSNVFFHETSIKTHQSRSLFIDVNSSPIENINLKTQNYIIKENNLFKGTGINSDNFAVGDTLEGCMIIDQAFNNVRKQVQKCDLLSGFLLNNSLGGGSGGGITAKIFRNLREDYCSSIVQEHAVLPEFNSICNPLHIYNAVFLMHTLLEYTDITFFAENSAFDHRLLIQGNLKPTMNDINQVHAQNITQTSAPYRFSGNLNTNQRKICVNMVMFPRMKFMVSSFSGKNEKALHIENAFLDRNLSKLDFFMNSHSKWGIFTLQVNCRDSFAYENEIDTKVKLWIERKKLRVTQWLDCKVHMSINEPAFTSNPSTSAIINSRSVVKTFQQMSDCFTALFRRKAFINSYLSLGMDRMEFTESESNLNDIISEYTPFNDYDQEEIIEEMEVQ